ncbi:MAG: histidine phosphatase family protein, partial [Burkholderiaceae bacterium]
MSQSTGPQSLAYTHLIVIRHGETAWNRERRLQGQLDIPLNDTGRAQARALAEAL